MKFHDINICTIQAKKVKCLALNRGTICFGSMLFLCRLCRNTAQRGVILKIHTQRHCQINSASFLTRRLCIMFSLQASDHLSVQCAIRDFAKKPICKSTRRLTVRPRLTSVVFVTRHLDTSLISILIWQLIATSGKTPLTSYLYNFV